MAIFHLSVKVISRASGRSAVAASAYRAAERLHDDRLDRDHDFTNKDGVVQLGSDVTVKTERGDRQFASGDCIMFLRNERGLGVKNGTLGIVERVTPQAMAVRTDDDSR